MPDIDISQLPAPTVIVQKTHAQLIEEAKADLIAEGHPITNLTASDPSYRQILASTYRELLSREYGQAMAKGLMLAFAVDAALDHIGITYYRTLRLPGEGNDAYRYRLQLSLEGLADAGTEGGYESRVLAVSSDIKAALPESAIPCEVDIYILTRIGNGAASPALLSQVAAAVNTKRGRAQGDVLRFHSAEILEYTLSVQLTLRTGPGAAEALTKAEADLRAYLAAEHRLKGEVDESQIKARLINAGVKRAVLTGWTNIQATAHQAPYCTALTITVVGYE